MDTLFSSPIVITGAAGFIGSNVAKALLKQGATVIGIDNLNDYYNPAWKEENLAELRPYPTFHFYHHDILHQEAVAALFEKHRPGCVIHLAARAGVRPSIVQPELYAEVNIMGTLYMLEAARKYGVKRFVFASSSSVYGNQSSVPFTESDPCNSPVSPYAATKKTGELLCYNYSHLYDLSCACLRFFTVYGPHGRPDMAPYLFTEAILHDRPITQYGDGSTQRDYTYIDDIVAGILAAAAYDSQFDVFNLGNDQPVSLRHFIQTLEKITGKSAHLELKPIPAGDVDRTWADISKAKQLLHYQPQTSFEDGLARFVAWYSTTRLS